MIRNKIYTIQAIVAYLLMVVGIIYIVLYIHTYLNSLSEGFQSGTTCTTKIIGDRSTYLCPNVDSANTLLFAGVKSPICYTDSNINYSDTTGSIGYTCFDMNGDPEFDSERGVYVPFDPIINDDPMPGNGIDSYYIGTNTFRGGYNTFNKAYTDVETLRSTISSVGLINIISVQSRLQVLSTTYCGITYANRNIDACTAISSAITTTSNFINDNSVNSLSYINNTLTDSKNKIKTILYDNFIQSFYTTPSVFISSPRIAEYLANKS
jgi:hypothetical protein